MDTASAVTHTAEMWVQHAQGEQFHFHHAWLAV